MLSNIIKSTTAPLHTRLEQDLFAAAIMDGSFTLADYNKVLRVNYMVHQLLEPVIFDVLGERISQEVELTKRRKLHALEEDMEASGINLSQDRQLPVERPAFNSEAEALGALYVLEGATLGGQVIIKRLKKNDLFATLPLAYYNVYADRTGVMWKQFLEKINQYEDHSSALLGAQKVYKLYLEIAEAIKPA
ncbi:biliverdin-producing heme oxygenase [Niabella sp. CJ426]|uniref:biliverdin-producing heme oxygenase n=1 Tax=Niabella sp. CJ426 TaxID=3393740 RepID=UPI003CFE696A